MQKTVDHFIFPRMVPFSLVKNKKLIMLTLHHSVVSDSVTPWPRALWIALYVGFFRQEYWGGMPFLSSG